MTRVHALCIPCAYEFRFVHGLTHRAVGWVLTIVVGRIAHPPRTASKRAKREAGIWQRRFWEHHVRGPEDYDALLRYCWMNPVKHGFVAEPTDWTYSSVHRDLASGRLNLG